MPVVFSGHEASIDAEQLTAKILAHLAATEPEASLPLLRELLLLLRQHTPQAYLQILSPEELADWLRTFFTFLRQRSGDISIDLRALTDRRLLLLTNTPDAPFLLDSIQNLLREEDLAFQVIFHPIVKVRRRGGELLAIGEGVPKGISESFMALLVEGAGTETAGRLRQAVTGILHAALCVQNDSQSLRRQLKEVEKITASAAAREFLTWLQHDNFLPFAYHRLLVGPAGLVSQQGGSGLGLPLAEELPPASEELAMSELPPVVRGRLQRKRTVMVEESAEISLLHRREPLIYLGVREKLPDGGWLEHAFWGLFTQKAVDEPPCSSPVLCRKIEQALTTLQLPRDSHDYRKSLELLETFPKVELFFMPVEELAQTARSFNRLYRRQGAVKVVGTRGSSETGMMLLVIMPRDFYSAENLLRMEQYIGRFFRSAAVSTRIVRISTDYLSFHAAVKPGARSAPPDLLQLERGLTHLVRPWKSKLRMLFVRDFGEEAGARLWERYREGFSREYQALTHPRFAIRDVRGAERVLASGAEAFGLWGPFGSGAAAYFRLQFYSSQRSDLNELLPILENLHLRVIDEVDFILQGDSRAVFIKSFSVRAVQGLALAGVREKLLELLVALRKGELEDDPLNRLLILTGLDGRQIDVFRGYANYLRQLNPSAGKKRIAQALIRHPQVASLLYAYFQARFEPLVDGAAATGGREEALSPLRQDLLSALRTVTDLGDDRILRTLFNLIDSTVRTNFFFGRSSAEHFFSFKISALGIIDMPAPRPLFEIYVHAAHMEGIHLRGGKVARGGIRWSDRPEDFRTEILGLMKTQMSKNALIVPVGAKGGFIIKGAPVGGERQAADQAYQTLIRGLLDLTDNRLEDELLRHPQLVAHDEEDSYLVVAADKGTAHLSNTANAISAEYGFWLGDAFASGGAQGYDHKALGITARGAWVCAQRHFWEMGRDIQKEPFTVIGIGDMSGDVFGNGMLLSGQIRLLAAFDHRHIFLDPDPEPVSSFVERQRLFRLPRSSWDDYDRTLLSAGGGIFSRQEKEILLSAQVRSWLGVRREVADGEELIRLLLAGEADLLWNGGIGTYVRASSEKDEEVGDRANDAVRIEASQLRVRVVGEGGNLGLTQKARIEFALAGGRINTDAVDNSAGVDCSDHEVNLKIFMQHLAARGALAIGERDRLLVEVTDDVCQAVLANNAGQSLCLSLEQRRSMSDAEPYLDLAERLGAAGLLDRRGESLPTLKEVLARPDRQLTRPELAVLMAYSKMHHHQLLLESDLVASPALHQILADYFPPLLRERFAAQMAEHPLARQICATMIGNLLVNQAGSAFLNPLSRQMGAPPAEVIAAYLAFDRILEGAALRREIGKVGQCSGAEREYALLLQLEEVLAGLCKWALKHGMRVFPEEERVASLRADLVSYRKILGSILAPVQWQQLQETAGRLQDEGLAAEWAQSVAALPYLEDLLPSITLAERTGADLHSVARTYNEVRQQLDMEAVLRQFSGMQLRDRWDRMAAQMLKEAFAATAFSISQAVWQESGGNLEAFFGRRRQQINFYRSLRETLRRGTPANFHPLTVLVRALEDLLSRADVP